MYSWFASYVHVFENPEVVNRSSLRYVHPGAPYCLWPAVARRKLLLQPQLWWHTGSKYTNIHVYTCTQRDIWKMDHGLNPGVQRQKKGSPEHCGASSGTRPYTQRQIYDPQKHTCSDLTAGVLIPHKHRSSRACLRLYRSWNGPVRYAPEMQNTQPSITYTCMLPKARYTKCPRSVSPPWPKQA